tara:strand:+ start:1038 stop:1964 length:927 start_codon:yes stop_codon:yes gene_type:complete
MKTLKVILLLIFIILFNNYANSQIVIKYKVGDEIITNLDIINEKNYLIFLRPNLQELSEEEILKISADSLINEVIKKKEIIKVFKDLNNEVLIDEIKKKLLQFKNVKNEDAFKALLDNRNIDFGDIVEKMKYEAFWNELIYQKYNALIKINEDKLKSELKFKISENKKYEYNISELLFEIEKSETLESKYKRILQYIKLNNFKAAASRFSISNTSKSGGEIGWVKETLLSQNLISLLENTKKFEITKPIKYPNGYLLLKINDKKEMKQTINLNKELKELIKYEKNRQLNQFSLLFYKKLKQNIIIYEY